jgi:hypothetical protein
VAWKALNPARGDQSPRAGSLWGDQTTPGPAGFLVAFVDGFSSPPHIHNVTYRGVVLGAEVHNADAAAPEQWMPAGSYWTQPAGVPHITSAKGAGAVAYIEIDDGPYLVKPTAEAFDPGESPINVHADNLVWVPASELASSAADTVFLWGEPGKGSGRLIRLPAASTATVRSEAAHRMVVVAGEVVRAKTALAAGSHVGADGAAAHGLACTSEELCVMYVRAEGAVAVGP